MRLFTQLFCEIDQTNRTNEKVAALESYFAKVPPEDGAWALYFLTGQKLQKVVSTRQLSEWGSELSGIPPWLLEECRESVGDLAETLALVLPRSVGTVEGTDLPLHRLIQDRLWEMRGLSDPEKRTIVLRTWSELNGDQHLVWNKIIRGNFRMGVARTLVVRALANVVGVTPAVMAHRLSGKWKPLVEDYRRLMDPKTEDHLARPYPFFLASPLEQATTDLGPVSEWQLEWKWDGIRAQLIRREGETLLWTRGDELVSDSFPEIRSAGDPLPSGTVLDGEILAWSGANPLPFGILQRRLNRKSVTSAIQRESPVVFVTYDLLEWEGVDMRERPLAERRSELEKVVQSLQRPGIPLVLSELVEASSWEEAADLQKQSRDRGVEGLMLKRRASPYRVGRQRGDWWKWKVDPFVIDAVLVYAQRGSGKRAGVYSDYTFALWDQGELVPVAKAYSGLTDEEIQQVDAFIRRESVQKHGPVQIVKPELVFELAFEGIHASKRHRSGVAVRFPRINRWRKDKKPNEADTLESLKKLASWVEAPPVKTTKTTHPDLFEWAKAREDRES